MPITTIVRNARLSFDKNLFDPTEKKGKKPGKRSCNLICSEDTSFFKLVDRQKVPVKPEDLTKLFEDALKQKFSGKVPPKYENWANRPNEKGSSATTGERYKGYEDDKGFYFAPSRNEDNGFPAFVRLDGSVINVLTDDGLAEARRLFYGGCYVTAKINVAAYETKEDNITKRGVTTYLEGLQFLRHGERFGGGEANAEGFEAEESASEIGDEDGGFE